MESTALSKYVSNAGNFDCHADVAVQYGAHCPMEHSRHGRRFWLKTQNTNKKTIFS
jgi:hypothetical protein